MGSVVEYHCAACAFSSGRLHIGWGKTGRAAFWGGLARCEQCGDLGVADLTARKRLGGTEPRCARCEALLTLLEGTSVGITCPRCRAPLRHETLGTWT